MARALHALYQLAFVWHQLEAKSWSVSNEHQKIFYESYEILVNPLCCKVMLVFISPRLSLCVYYNLYGCFTTQGTKTSIAFDVIPGISTMTVINVKTPLCT
jgi:hypothetical protein